MKRRSTSRRRQYNRRPARRQSRKKGGELKSNLLTIGIWALGLINVVLIASSLSNILKSSTDEPASINGALEKRVLVEVLNGCGARGIAKEVTDYLRARPGGQFDVVKFENYVVDGRVRWDEPRTMVIDRIDPSRGNAAAVARTLGVSDSGVLFLANQDRAVDVTVILGKDYKDLRLYRD